MSLRLPQFPHLYNGKNDLYHRKNDNNNKSKHVQGLLPLRCSSEHFTSTRQLILAQQSHKSVLLPPFSLPRLED